MTLDELDLWAANQATMHKPTVVRCCESASCLALSSSAVHEELSHALTQRGLTDRVEVRRVGCLRLCGQGPLVAVDPPGILYRNVTPATAPALVAAFAGQSDGRLDRGDPAAPFFARQLPVATRHVGHIDPERIDDAVAAGAYRALALALTGTPPADVIAAIERSGLRGRGGAGYPTGLKWATVAKARSDRKFVVGNADEGDPGAFMDRSILEGDPHAVLEGMAIAGYAVGADLGYLYVRAEYPLAIARLSVAIRQARQHGFLGPRLFGSAFSFDVEVRIGAGAFVCGEETALIASIKGGRGQPRPRPPFPAERGLWGHPTLINNVETLANIAPILQHGPEWYAALGTARSRGTKVFSLSGAVRNNGLVEVPMGVTIREIVEDIGGGAAGDIPIKAVQTGGPSGGCIPAALFDTPVDYESLARIGSIMGSGGMVVMDANTSMVDVARFYMQFCAEESCGKCVPCRAGTVQIHQILQRILARDATSADLTLLEELCETVRQTSLCGLGQTAPNPVLSTLRAFPAEYRALLRPDPAAPPPEPPST